MSFWDSQPVSKNLNNFKIINDLSIDQIQKEPYPLPENFYWYTPDLNNQKDLEEIYNFLYENYAEDITNTFRLHYSQNLLKWLLLQPNYNPNLHLIVKYKTKIYGCVFITPISLSVFDKIIFPTEANLLCTHKSLRDKRLAPVIIKESYRRACLEGLNLGYSTTTFDVPSVISKGYYYHRNLNIKKLIDANFLAPQNNLSLSSYLKLNKVWPDFTLKFRELNEKDITICCQLLNKFNQKFKIFKVFDDQLFKHHFLPQKDIISSLIVEKDNQITHFISFYYLDVNVLNNDKVKVINKAYLYYYFYFDDNFEELVQNALLFLKNKGVDVVDCIDQMDNNTIFKNCKFNKGSAYLNFTNMNWICPKVESKDVCVVTV
jgi:glycylpeptide N-tetradecanoyltransferase